MSLVRVGMGENKKYQDGFNAIFKKKATKKPAPPAAPTKPAAKAKKK